MKITLHKPQREAANAVLAYDYESPDEQEQILLGRDETASTNTMEQIGEQGDDEVLWSSYWASDAFCDDYEDCQHKHGAGDCTLYSNGTNQWC